jgi:hypothetical protein
MPHVKKRVKTRERQDGTTVSTTVYQAVWREHANGADRTKEFRRKADAERFLVDVQHRLMTGAYTDPVLGRTPFREVAERYLSLGVWKPKSRQTQRRSSATRSTSSATARSPASARTTFRR